MFNGKVIGLHGKARSGKDTVADILKEKLQEEGLKVEIMHFADPLKEAAMLMMDWTEDYVYGELKDKIDPFWGISPRQFLQVLGTEMMQEIMKEVPGYRYGKRHWVERLFKEVASSEADVILIPDTRFVQEAERIRFVNGSVIEVFDPIADEKQFKQGLYAHASEQGIDATFIDFRLENRKDGLDKLKETVISRMTEIYELPHAA